MIGTMVKQITDEIELSSGHILSNRAALAPLTNKQSNLDGTLHDDEYHWLLARSGHFGIVETCAAYVSAQGKAWEGQLGIANNSHLEGLTKLATGINQKGSFSLIQLYHGGDRAVLSTDPITSSATDFAREATYEDLESVKRDFVQAAKRAEQAGFNGVEVHGANGYLFTQFISRTLNLRSDEYGGSVENRSRLLVDTVRQIKEEVNSSFSVNVRISPVDTWSRSGLILEDAIQISKRLAGEGIDMIHLSLRDASGPAPFEADTRSVVEIIRESVSTDVKIVAAGGIKNYTDVSKALATGLDIVSVGRAGIVQADWPFHVQDPNFDLPTIPWSQELLSSQAVSPRFYEYLKKFSGLVEGGNPLR